MLWRQGDVYLSEIPEIPKAAKPVDHCVLAEGEATGHSHRILETGRAEILEFDQKRYLRVVDSFVTLVHDEHAPIVLNPGLYRFWQQREYTPQGIRTVRD